MILTIVFNRVVRLESIEGVPYFLIVLSGVMAWGLFSGILTDSSMSVVNKASMVRKIYFPRVIMPLSPVLVNLIDFFIIFLIYIVVALVLGIIPSLKIIFLPLFILFLIFFVSGLTLLFSALCVRYRDVKHIVPFVTQIGLYVSPIGYMASLVPEKWLILFYINPVVCVVEGLRWCLIPSYPELYVEGILISSVVSIAVFFTGITYFFRQERFFADVI